MVDHPPREFGPAPDELAEDEQRDRYRELLEELRTILPGVQVLLAFLLTAPFATRFDHLDRLGRDVFAAALLGTALAATALIAPTAYHRLARRQDRAERLRIAVRLAVAGMALLAASVAAAVFVVARFVYHDGSVGLVFGAIAGLGALGLWFVLPLSRR
jgi:hypothetical protein